MKRYFAILATVLTVILIIGLQTEVRTQTPVKVTNIPADSAENAAPTTPPVPLGCRYRSYGTLPTITTGNMAYPGCNLNGIFLVQTAGDNIVTNQVIIGTSATLVAAARVGRVSLGVTSPGSQVLYCGGTGVTTSTGQILPAQALTVNYTTTAAVYCLVGTSTMTVSYAETY